MIVKTEGIILRSFDFRETSRIATFFTKEYGKVSGILKGIRKDPKKFGSSLERFSINDIVYYQYRNSDLHLVSQCDLRQFFYPTRKDLKKSLAAIYILELVNVIMPAEEKNTKVYELMTDFLTALQDAEDITPLIHIFQIKMLLYSGFKPHLYSLLIF
jgi:DNA repair protein RecO (recombination protein O)